MCVCLVLPGVPALNKTRNTKMRTLLLVELVIMWTKEEEEEKKTEITMSYLLYAMMYRRRLFAACKRRRRERRVFVGRADARQPPTQWADNIQKDREKERKKKKTSNCIFFHR